VAILTLAAVFALFLALAFFRASLASWLIALIVIVPVLAIQSRMSDSALQAIYLSLALLALLFGIPALRRAVISRAALKAFRKILTRVSAAGGDTLEAGTVWWEAELLSGQPGWDKLLAFPKCGLNVAEQAFLDNEAEQLCAMLDDWDIAHRRADLPPEVWQFIKIKGFFGMTIPKHHGGLGFSAQAHSAVVAKIASRSGTAAMTVMAPHFSDIAGLLLRYGTEAQKEKYLRRLAYGLEVPCLALSEPSGGTDVGEISDEGEVCYGRFEGRQNVPGVRLAWEKRHVTLAPAASLICLVFRLRDPGNLLGGGIERGITLALVPACLPGVHIGRRHLPMNCGLLNGTTQGRDVFIPMDYLIGGQPCIGHGWHMMMECLAAGRGISLPASSAGSTKLAARTSGAYARVRRQPHLPIGGFEGVEEPLARIGAHTYMIDAACRFSALAVDLGGKPVVASALAQYHATERARGAINDAMDVHGGKGIFLGPHNYLARAYQQASAGATLEGENILTRNMVSFAQGTIRAHPYVLKEIAALHDPERAHAVHRFDEALFGHVGFALNNAARSFVFALLNGRGIPTPPGNETRRYYQQMTRFSASLALFSEAALTMPDGWQRHENIAARLGNALGMLYLGTATLKRFEDEGRPAEDLPLLHWAMQDALYQAQQTFAGAIRNFPNTPARWLLRALIFPVGARLSPPSDSLGREIAALLMQPGTARDRLTAGMHLPHSEEDAVGALEAAFVSTLACEALRVALEQAYKAGKLKARQEWPRIAEACAQGLITAEQAAQLERDYALRRKAMHVDDFAPDELHAGG
jgi:acyl-CoA dehydrogenase